MYSSRGKAIAVSKMSVQMTKKCNSFFFIIVPQRLGNPISRLVQGGRNGNKKKKYDIHLLFAFNPSASTEQI
jgi:hypothetical protein